jgi:hypothetical protein
LLLILNYFVFFQNQTQSNEDSRPAPIMSKSDDVDIERSEEHSDALAVMLSGQL